VPIGARVGGSSADVRYARSVRRFGPRIGSYGRLRKHVSLPPALEWSVVAPRPLDLHAFVGEVHGVSGRANVALPVHLARPCFEERRAATEHHRGEVQAQLVDEALFERLADDVAAAHDHDVTKGRGGPRLVDRGDQIADEGEAHPQFAFQPDVSRRRVCDDEERRRPCLIGADPMSLFQPSAPLTMSNNRRPITTAPLSAVACSRISVSTAS
jgi:hypothetical protein